MRVRWIVPRRRAAAFGIQARVAVAIGLLAVLALPGAVLAATPISVFVLTGQQCIEGLGPANANVSATLRTPGGQIRGRFQASSDGEGYWFGCFRAPINGRDKLAVTAGNQSRTIVIPRLEPEIDRVQDVIEGFAPPHAPVLVLMSHRQTLNKSKSFTFEATADGSGHYSVDTTGEVNLRGGDAVTVITTNGNDQFGALVIAPFISVAHAQNIAAGTVNNGTDLVIELRDSHGSLKADVTAGSAAAFFGISLFQVSLYDEGGSAAYPVAGDHVIATLASDADLLMPSGYLNGDPATDVVSGRCMANAPYALQARFRTFYGKTDSSGRVTRDLTGKMNLKRGDDLQLTCLYPTGDTWTRVGLAQ